MKTVVSIEQLECLLAENEPELRDQVRRLYRDWSEVTHQLKLLRLALDAVPEEVYIKNTEGQLVFANKVTADINHLSPDDIIGKTDFDLFDQNRAADFRREEQEILKTGRPHHGVLEGRILENGRPHWCQSSKYPLIDDGTPLGLCGISRHVTTQKQTEVMLLAQSEILEMVAANKPLHDIFARITKLNDGQLNGVQSSILLLDEEGLRFEHVVSTSIPRRYCDQLIGLEIADNTGSCGTACYRKETVIVDDIQTDPKWAPFSSLVEPYGYRSCWSAPIIRSDGSVAGSFALYSKNVRKPDSFEMQIVELGRRLAAIAIDSHMAAETIRIAAEKDSLTGLTNRNTFSGLLAGAIDRAEDNGNRFAVVYIDFNDFKLVNDRYGHHAGDEFLKTVSRRMMHGAGQRGTIARLGGDEFVLLVDTIGSTAELERDVAAFMDSIQEPVSICGNQVNVSGSAGIAVFPDHGLNADQLLGHADAAMYHVKRDQGEKVKTYDPEIDRDIRDRQERIVELKAGIERNEIDIDFQPQFDLHKQNIVGFEALARWQSPRFGRLAPAFFIQLAEEADLILPLGESVLRQACMRARSWRATAGKAVRVAVNVSPHQFKDGIILRQVERALKGSGLDPRFLELELTESVLMQDVTAAVKTMTELKSMGVEVSLDDFGTGYSNLSALAAFPIDRLKIDRSIIQNIGDNKAGAAIASAIIAMGHKLDVQVLAEGVETQEQLDFLVANKCDLIQGFLLGKPVGFEETLKLLRNDCDMSLPSVFEPKMASGAA